MLRPLTLFAACCGLLSACSSGKDNKDKQYTEQVTRLNTAYDSALLASDTARIGRLYAPDYQFITTEGQVLDRNAQLGSIKSGGMLFQYAKSDDLKVRLYGDVAVMTGLFTGRGVYKGNPIDIKERFSSVWVRRDTTWQMVQEQTTQLASGQ